MRRSLPGHIQHRTVLLAQGTSLGELFACDRRLQYTPVQLRLEPGWVQGVLGVPDVSQPCLGRVASESDSSQGGARRTLTHEGTVDVCSAGPLLGRSFHRHIVLIIKVVVLFMPDVCLLQTHSSTLAMRHASFFGRSAPDSGTRQCDILSIRHSKPLIGGERQVRDKQHGWRRLTLLCGASRSSETCASSSPTGSAGVLRRRDSCLLPS